MLIQIYKNGHCTPGELDGYATSHGHGSNVSVGGIGWVFDDLDKTSLRSGRRGAFPHDAGVWRQLGAKHSRLRECSSTKGSSLYERGLQYAQGRYEATVADANASVGGKRYTQHYSSFLSNKSHNCFSSLWHEAFARQRAFATLRAKAGPYSQAAIHEGPDSGFEGCHYQRGALYNQIHTSWRRVNKSAHPFAAIFYVNGTQAPEYGNTKHSQEVVPALYAAELSLQMALDAQKSVVERLGSVLPVLQFKTVSECDDPKPLMRRLEAAASAASDAVEAHNRLRSKPALALPNLFTPPPRASMI